MAGYSGTPLIQKLGIKPNEHVIALGPPENYQKLLGKLPSGAQMARRVTRNATFVHFFTTRRADLRMRLKELRSKMADHGSLWISWPKKSSGVATDVTEDVIRAEALPLGFVDTKVCAVDETWSGLKLMVRRENRRS